MPTLLHVLSANLLKSLALHTLSPALLLGSAGSNPVQSSLEALN